MNLVLVLGAAVGSRDFCQLLIDDPLRAAALLHITLTETELHELKQTFSSERGAELCEAFARLYTVICRHPPCAFAVVIPKCTDVPGQAAA